MGFRLENALNDAAKVFSESRERLRASDEKEEEEDGTRRACVGGMAG
jgi:hypothetical protein